MIGVGAEFATEICCLSTDDSKSVSASTRDAVTLLDQKICQVKIMNQIMNLQTGGTDFNFRYKGTKFQCQQHRAVV